VFLTGATGFLGMELLARYLEQTDRRIYALVRGADDQEAYRRIQHTLLELFGPVHGYADRVVALRGDLTQIGMGIAPSIDRLAERVTEIAHCAAAVSFEQPLEQARLINVDGTRRVLEFAERCQARGRLRRMSYISTAYVAGEHVGCFSEDDLDHGQRFRNSYEQSKFEAERLVRDAGLPTMILRPSIVVGDRNSGWTSAFNVLYWPLRAFARGLYPAVPAVRTSPVDVVSIDYVADAIYSLCQTAEAAGQTYHLTAGSQASSVGELVDLASRYFKRPPPQVLSATEFAEYAKTMTGVQRSALGQSAAYFPYFAVDTEFDNAAARAQLEPAGISVAPLASYLNRLLDFATRSRWGKRPIGRAEALAV